MTNIKWIWSFIKTQKLLYFGCIILLLIESAAEIFAIQMQQYIIDEVIIVGEYDKLWLYIPLIAIFYVIFIILFVINPYIQSKIHGRVKIQVQEKALSYFYKMPFKQIQQDRNAKYVHYFTNEIPIVSRVIGEDIADIVKYGFNTLLICGLMVYSAPFILIAIIFLSIVYIYLGKKFNRKQKEAWKVIQKEKSKFLVTLEEGVTSTRDIIATNSYEWESKRFKSKYNSYFQSLMREGRLKIQQVYSMESLTLGTQLFVLGYGGYLVLNGAISIGTLVVIFQLTSTLIESFIKLYNLLFTFSGKLASIENIKKWIEEPLSKKEYRPLKENSIDQLSLENVYFRHHHDSEYVLKNLSINIPVGKKIAVVGPSGSGKSTIASLLLKFSKPEKGIIKVNGLDLETISMQDWRKRISVVFQDDYLFPSTIKDNLLLGYKMDDESLLKLCESMQISEMIERLPNKFESVIGERGVTISGGQKQRLSLVRAILRNPDILVLDESTSALDVHTERKIQLEIDKIRKGKTTIIIAHRLSTIQNADVIFVIKDGEIIEEGSHSELLNKNTVYADLIQNELDSFHKEA